MSSLASHANFSPAVDAQTRATARRIGWLGMAPFVLVHLGVFGAIWSGVTWQAIVMCVVLYIVRMFAVTGVYHRYFSHRTYRTSRFMQFLLAFLAQTSSQRGVLWWAAHHRKHHKVSDQPEDVHSPRQDGFWYAHLLWIFDRDNTETDVARIKDFAKFPELRFLDRVWWLPPWVLGFACYFIAGGPGLFIGFFLSTVLLWHGTFTINSLAHVWGWRRFKTTDDSRNNFFLALITLGEGWHNNHHHYMHSTRQGFYKGEIDITYGILKGMEKLGLVWKLREPPQRVLDVAAHTP